LSAFDEIDALVEVGPRAPGSDAERRAALHIQARLTSLGRQAVVEPITAWPHWPQAYALCATLSVLGSVLSVSLPPAGAALALAGALLLFLDAGLLIPLVRAALGRRASQNVISAGVRERPGLLLVVAHYDAGRGGLALGAKARERLAALGHSLRRPVGALELVFWVQLAVLACCLLRLAGLDGTALSIVQFVPTVMLIVAVALLLEIAVCGTRGGENDNASGVALALRLAERFAAGQLDYFDVHVLFAGAQKARAAGMRSFIKRHRAELAHEHTVFLNLDEVGSGTTRYARREGPLIARKAHPQLLELCDSIAEDDADGRAGPIVIRAASDAYAARARGFPAVTVTCRDERGYAPPRVDEEAIDRAEAFCAELIARLDAELGPAVAARISSGG
jgi:hypothetical protein